MLVKFPAASLRLVPIAALLLAQANPNVHSYLPHGIVKHNDRDSLGTVTANDPRPLYQAVDALQAEYGWKTWLIDYEDPPFESPFDLIDDTAAEWRAAHPSAKGVTVPSGGQFESIYPEPPDGQWSSAAIEKVLTKVVSDYNKTANPGKFAVHKEAENRFAVVGTAVKDQSGHDRPVPAILNSTISLPLQERTADETLDLIAKRLSGKLGTIVAYAGFEGMADNCAIQSIVTVGGDNVPARSLLLQTVDHMGCLRVWRLIYNADAPEYFLSFRNEIRAR
jgi:hypothetical protein